MSWLTPLPPPEVNNYVYMAVSTWISAVYDPAVTPDYITHLWDANGRVATRTIGSMTGMVTETTSFGYHDRLLNLVLTKPAPTEIPCPLTTPTAESNYSLKDSWTYRYGPGGIREQKRLMTSPQHDRMSCGVAPWVAYVLSPGGQQLAVYHGRQVSENTCAPAGFGYYERRVHIYPVEFRSYGPDGINVIFERNAGGVMTKRFVTTNNQGSIVSVTDNAGYEASAVYDNFGSPTNAYTRRTGWLDRERDFETSPLSDKHKLYDLEARKYDASTGQFLSVDPLWMQFLSSSSYVYCEGDPVNGIDPWGLAGESTPLKPGPGAPRPRLRTKNLPNEWGRDDEQAAKDAQKEVTMMGPSKSLILPNNEAWKEASRPKGNLKGGEKRLYTSREVVVTASRFVRDNRSSVGDWVTAFGASTTIVNGTVAGSYDLVKRVQYMRVMQARKTPTMPMPASLGVGMKGYLRFSKKLGIAGAILDVGFNFVLFSQKPSLRTFAPLFFGACISASAFIPHVGFGCAIGFTAAELQWGDEFYNGLSDKLWW